MLCPARDYEASKLRRIAVLPFEGPDGKQLSSEVEALLVGIAVGGKPYFHVVDRRTLKKVIEEQRLGMSGLITEATAAKIGSIVGADGIMMGIVNRRNVQNKYYTQRETRCIEENSKGKCLKWGQYSVRCTERTAYFSFTPKVVKVNTGEVVASETLTGRAQSSACSDSGYGVGDKVQLLSKAQQEALAKLRPLLAPYYVDVKIKLITKDDTKMPKEVQEKIAEGVKWIKANRLDRARDLWQQAYDMHKEGYATPYLMGFCAEMEGDYKKALAYYTAADNDTKSPNDTINAALTRVRAKMDDAKKLQGVK
jgi:curli biogenesis system outer membrane secretion channel CsgG